MSQPLVVRLPKYHKPFDDSDNTCCWQVDRVAEEIETLLKVRGITAETMSEDWGFAFDWKNGDGIEHDLTIECTNVDTAVRVHLLRHASRLVLLLAGRPTPRFRLCLVGAGDSQTCRLRLCSSVPTCLCGLITTRQGRRKPVEGETNPTRASPSG